MKTKRIMAVLMGSTFGLLLLLVSPGTSQAIPFDLTAGGDFGAEGNKGIIASATVGGLTLELGAFTSILETQLYLDPTIAGDPGTETGTVYIAPLGAGVQEGDLDLGGSKGISGKGKQKDEALILDFSTDVDVSSFVLTFTDYQLDSDQLLIYLDPDPESSGPTLGAFLDNSIIEDALVDIGRGIWELSFSDLGLDITSFDTLYVRNTGNEKGAEFYVTGVNATAAAPVPEPSTIALLGIGLVGLLGSAARKRYKRKRQQ